MKIAFHLAHPAHFHLFRNIIRELVIRHDVLVTYNEKDVLRRLVDHSDLRSIAINIKSGRKSGRLYGLLGQFIKKEINLFWVIKDHRPDLIMGTSIIIAHVGYLLRIPSVIVNEDDFDVVSGSAKIGYPFCSHILAPTCCRTGKWKSKVIHYDGYHELSYLSPRYFVPDAEVLRPHMDLSTPYSIVRFSNLDAHHDVGKSGITFEIALQLVGRLKAFGNVYITSERDLEAELNAYRIKIDPLDIHHALYFATMYVGDSQTMAAEAAVLGTPSVRFNDFVGRLSYLEELEHQYGLTYGIKTLHPRRLFEKVDELIRMADLKVEWQRRREVMLGDKVDVVEFMVDFIDNYGRSARSSQRSLVGSG